MKPAYWVVIYFLALLADIGMIVFNVPDARFITKPLLMIILGCMAGRWRESCNFPPATSFSRLLFFLVGDVFLLFPQYFLPGLVSFLIAHLMYIGFFAGSRPRPKAGVVEILAMLMALGYAAIVLSVLYPKAGK